MKKILPVVVLVVLAVGAGSFYGGMKYSQSKVVRGMPGGEKFSNMQATGTKNQSMGGFGTMGEVIAKDDTSITVKLRDGGSKIVFCSDSTKIQKTVEGAFEDLSVGQTVVASGASNDDGSVTAQSVQISLDMDQIK